MNEIAKLKQDIVKAKDLGVVVNAFFDLVDQNIILDSGEDHKVNNIKDHQDLCLAINIALDTAGNFLNKPVQMTEYQFIQLPQENFFHGSCIVPGFLTPLLLLYCADTQVGITAVTDLQNETHFSRFSLTMVPPTTQRH